VSPRRSTGGDGGGGDNPDASWRDPASDESPNPPGFAGSWGRIRPRFDDPMSWSVPIGQVAGVSIRLHLFFLLFVAVELLRASFPAGDGLGTSLSPAVVATALALLFAIVLLHEFGHCIACRRFGGIADEILLWPLGGLAACQPPDEARAHLATAVGGPLVHVAILAVTVPWLGFATGEWFGVAIPSPFSLAGIWPFLDRWDLIVLYLANWLSLVLLLFNLLPLFPLDGGRILHAILWPRLGYAPAMRVACRAGFVGAILLGVVGFWQANFLLVMIAIFGALTCVQTLRQLEFTEEALSLSDGDAFARLAATRREEEEAERREAERERLRRAEEQERRQREEAEFDRILDKIRQQGMSSLSASERRILERETERRRKKQ
jgi:Zn-dependent protease